MWNAECGKRNHKNKGVFTDICRLRAARCPLFPSRMLAHLSEHCQERMHPVKAAFAARHASPPATARHERAGKANRAGSLEELVMESQLESDQIP